jgi:hypothetical protein
MQENSTNEMSLRAVNQSVDEIRERNRALERDLLNIVKLFYLYQRHIEYKIEKARNANEMALEFLTILGEQVDGVRRLVEESEYIPDGSMLGLKRDHQSEEKASRDFRDRSGASNQEPWRKKFAKRPSQDATSNKIINDLNGNKDQMIKEIQESQSSLNFILDYLRKLNFGKENSHNLGSSQHSDSNKSIHSNMNPENILNLADVDEFLVKTSHFFSGQKNHVENEKGVKAYLVRIADLQKELKKKDEELAKLASKLATLESGQNREKEQLGGRHLSSRGAQETIGEALCASERSEGTGSEQ